MTAPMRGLGCRGHSAWMTCRLSCRIASSTRMDRSNTTTKILRRSRYRLRRQRRHRHVDGAIAPVARVPTGLVRLRLLNAANAQNFELRFSDRRVFHVIASDGGFLSAPGRTQLVIAPAERFEVLVDFADGKPVMLETGPDEQMGAFGRLAPDGSSDYVPVMRFEPTATKHCFQGVADALDEPAPVNPASAVRRRQLILNSGLCATRTETGRHAEMASLIGINGKPFDIGRIDIETKLGTTEVWQITSIGMAHPFHVHGALFQNPIH